MMRPVVGVMPLWDDEKESIWMLPGYMDGIREAGGLPVIFPMTDDTDDIKQLCGMCSGFLFTGGHDVSPELYGEEKLNDSVVCCGARDELEKRVLDIAIGDDKPVLGICRGIQFINAALGGTLYQDLNTQHPSETEHHQEPPYDKPAHGVRILDGTPLKRLIPGEDIAVNSYHHQAVRDLSPELKAMAVSVDGLVEAVYRPGSKFIWAVQWHPEFSYKVDRYGKALFEAFMESMQ